MKKFFNDFKKFISRGNILDMAVGVIIGGAFNAIVTAFTNKIVMPLINLLLSIGGENGLEKAYTVLKWGYTDGVRDLSKSIYIDWGAFISAIINFLIIALTLFIILKVAMKSSEMFKHSVASYNKGKPTKEEKMELVERGVNMKSSKERKAALEALRLEREEARAAEEAAKEAAMPKVETDSEILKDIRDLMRAQAEEKAEKKPAAKKTTKK